LLPLCYLSEDMGINFNSRYQLENCIIFYVTARLITHSEISVSSISTGLLEDGSGAKVLKERLARKRQMRNELSSALRRILLCIIHGHAQAGLLTTSCDERALQTPHAPSYVDDVRTRRWGEKENERVRLDGAQWCRRGEARL